MRRQRRPPPLDGAGRIVGDAAQRLGERAPVAGRQQQAVHTVLDHLGKRADARRHDRRAHCHRLEGHGGSALERNGGTAHDVHLAQVVEDVRGFDRRQEADPRIGADDLLQLGRDLQLAKIADRSAELEPERHVAKGAHGAR
jgi:hypothetical protein